MKKTITTIYFVLFIILLANSQEKKHFTKYENTYAQRSYDIKIKYDDTSNYKIEIDLMTYDNRYLEGGLVLTHKTLPGFLEALDSAMEYYSKWVVPAKARKGSKKNVQYFQEEKIIGFFDEKKKTRIDFPLRVKYQYRVLKHKDDLIYVLDIATGKIRAQHGNQYTVQSFSMLFLSAQEIHDFKELITIDKVKAFIVGSN